jgi:flagellin
MQIRAAQGGFQLVTGANKAGKALRKTNKDLQKILQKLSTAVRINQASDDAAGLAVSEQLRSQIRGYKMATQNASDAMSSMNITDGAAGRTTAILQRQRELAIQAKNGTLNDNDRAALNVEFQALTAEITRLAEATGFNGQGTAAGADLANGTAQIQAGANVGDTITLPQIDFTADALGVTGTSVATAADAEAAMTALDNALNAVSNQRSAVGATVNRFESTINNLAVSMANTQAAESVLRDQDMAMGLADLTRARLLQEGATRAFSRFNEINRNNMMGLMQ